MDVLVCVYIQYVALWTTADSLPQAANLDSHQFKLCTYILYIHCREL